MGDAASTGPDDPAAAKSPSLDASASGLRKRGDTTGGDSLTAAASDVVEAYWSVQNASLLRILRNGEETGAPRRATSQSCPLALSGLAPGDHEYKLIPGSGPDDWVEDAALTFKLTLTAAPVMTKLWADPEPDGDGKEHLSRDLQLAEGTKIKLHFETAGATQVRITATPDGESASALAPVDVDETGTGTLIVDPADKLTLYTAEALNGDVAGAPEGPVTVHFHPAEKIVSPLVDINGLGASALLNIRDASGAFGTDGTLRCGAHDGVQLEWTVTGAKSAHLSATSLVKKPGTAPETKGTAAHVSDDQLLTSGLDLSLDAEGSGSGTVVVDPGPTGATEYTLNVEPADETSEAASAKATAYVANFNVQVRLPDGSDFARNKACVLEIENQDPVQGTTNDAGELWLWLPNTAAAAATLRVLDGGQELASWTVELLQEEEIAGGVAAPQS
jgi:hypothetical protein